jgi:hypothetical protein
VFCARHHLPVTRENQVPIGNLFYVFKAGLALLFSLKTREMMWKVLSDQNARNAAPRRCIP